MWTYLQLRDNFCRYSNLKELVKRQVENGQSLNIIGFHVLATAKEPELEDGIPSFRAGSDVTFRLFGEGFSENTMIGMTSEALESGAKCHKIVSDTFKVSEKKVAQEFSLETHYLRLRAGERER